MNTTKHTSTPETHKHKVVFTPQGILAFVHSIIPKGAILKFEKNGKHACACFDNVIDFNNFRNTLALITTV